MSALSSSSAEGQKSDGVRALKHPGSDRVGGWIQTFTGIQFWPLDPRPDEVDIRDIAHALSNQCRFAGHCEEFYSVAEHSVRVSLQCPCHPLWGLLHDAAEAYLVDLPRPIKRWSQMGVLYSEIEDTVMMAVAGRFGLTFPMPAEVKRADVVLLVTEKRDLMKMPPKPWEDTETPIRETITSDGPWSPKTAEAKFLEEFTLLQMDRLMLQRANAGKSQPTKDSREEPQQKRSE